MKLLSVDVQEYLIALALVIIIPATVYFGCNVIAPLVVNEQYAKKQEVFFDGYNFNNRDEYQKRAKEWQETPEYIEHEQKICKRATIHLVIQGVVSSAAFAVGPMIVMPVMSAAVTAAGLILYVMYKHSYAWCKKVHNLFWLEFMLVLMSLLIVLHASYKASEE